MKLYVFYDDSGNRQRVWTQSHDGLELVTRWDMRLRKPYTTHLSFYSINGEYLSRPQGMGSNRNLQGNAKPFNLSDYEKDGFYLDV